MMRSVARSAQCLSFLLYAAAALGEPDTAPQASARENSGAPSAATVTTTTIDPNVKYPVCKRYVPTGSRIATQRCETPQDETSAAQRAEHETIRRDLAEMRAVQALRDQARAQALAEALRRRAAGL
jgi:hypothetical protein